MINPQNFSGQIMAANKYAKSKSAMIPTMRVSIWSSYSFSQKRT